MELLQGTLEQRGWIAATWGTSDDNRRAKFDALTSSGRKRLASETRSWERLAGMMARLLKPEEGS